LKGGRLRYRFWGSMGAGDIAGGWEQRGGKEKQARVLCRRQKDHWTSRKGELLFFYRKKGHTKSGVNQWHKPPDGGGSSDTIGREGLVLVGDCREGTGGVDEKEREFARGEGKGTSRNSRHSPKPCRYEKRQRTVEAVFRLRGKGEPSFLKEKNEHAKRKLNF